MRKYGSFMAKSKRAEEIRIITRITNLSQKHPDSLLEDEKLEMAELSSKLDDLYKKKAEGAFIRSRKKWLEVGEQNSHYFFNLEKRNFVCNTVSAHLSFSFCFTRSCPIKQST